MYDGVQMAKFWRFFTSCISASRVQHISDLHSKFALRPHKVWKYGRQHTSTHDVSTIGKKNLSNSDTSSTCPYNMMNFGQLAAEIVGEFGAPIANFNGFRDFAALLHGTLGCQSNFAALNRGRHLYSAGH